MKTIPRCLLLVAWVLAGAVAQAAQLAVPFRNVSFDAALEAAAAENKLVFIDFYTTWCEPCKRLDADTFSDAAVGALVGGKAVPIKLDAEKGGRAVAQRYKVNAYPTMLLLKADGTEVDRLVGFREPARFIGEFKAALEGRNAEARAREDVARARGAIPAGADSKVDRETVQARYELGRTLARQGNHEGALAEYLWCFDVGMVEVASYFGVRSSFLLSDIGRIAKSYAPARVALVERRDAAEQRMHANREDRFVVMEYAALCDALDEEDRIVDLFSSLPAGDPRRSAIGLRAYRVFFARQRYEDAAAALPLATMVRMVDSSMNRPAPTPPNPNLLDAMKRASVRSMLDYVETLAGANRPDEAQQMIDKLKGFDGSAETDAQIEERLRRARLARGSQ